MWLQRGHWEQGWLLSLRLERARSDALGLFFRTLAVKRHCSASRIVSRRRLVCKNRFKTSHAALFVCKSQALNRVCKTWACKLASVLLQLDASPGFSCQKTACGALNAAPGGLYSQPEGTCATHEYAYRLPELQESRAAPLGNSALCGSESLSPPLRQDERPGPPWHLHDIATYNYWGKQSRKPCSSDSPTK